MSVHVTDLLKLPAFKLAHTCAGVRGLSREVKYIDVLESPDIENLTKPHVLYLTSGFAFYNNAVFQESIIARLAATGAAGLVFEHGRYLSALPSVMLEEANRICLPIIELPMGASFTDIIREGMEMIISRKETAWRRSQEAQKQLATVAASGGDLRQIAQTLANLVCNTVIIADDKFALLSFAFWDKAPHKHKRQAYAGNTLDQYLYNLLKTGFVDKIRQEKKIARAEVLFSMQGKQAWAIVPVSINGENLGFIAVLEDYNKLQEADWEALEQAAGVTAVPLYRKIAEEDVLRRQRHDFLLKILLDPNPSKPEVRQQADRLNLSINNRTILLQIAFVNLEQYCHRHYTASPGENNMLKSQLLDLLVAQLTAKHKDLLAVGHEEQIAVLCPAEELHSRPCVQAKIDQITQNFSSFAPELHCAIGVSRVCESYQYLSVAYKEAREALKIGCTLDANGGVFFYTDLGAYQILLPLQGSAQLADYYQAMLGPLNKVDAATRQDYIKTLETYFRTNANIYKTAQNLYLHRNTVKYRLERIEEILNIDLDEPEARFNVQLALKIRHLL